MTKLLLAGLHSTPTLPPQTSILATHTHLESFSRRLPYLDWAAIIQSVELKVCRPSALQAAASCRLLTICRGRAGTIPQRDSPEVTGLPAPAARCPQRSFRLRSVLVVNPDEIRASGPLQARSTRTGRGVRPKPTATAIPAGDSGGSDAARAPRRQAHQSAAPAGRRWHAGPH